MAYWASAPSKLLPILRKKIFFPYWPFFKRKIALIKCMQSVMHVGYGWQGYQIYLLTLQPPFTDDIPGPSEKNSWQHHLCSHISGLPLHDFRSPLFYVCIYYNPHFSTICSNYMNPLVQNARERWANAVLRDYPHCCLPWLLNERRHYTTLLQCNTFQEVPCVQMRHPYEVVSKCAQSPEVVSAQNVANRLLFHMWLLFTFCNFIYVRNLHDSNTKWA